MKLTKIPNQSVITTGNRFLGSISAEIKLLPERIGTMIESGEFNGFWFHNLAARCEMLEGCFGEKIRAIGCENTMYEIGYIGDAAREIQDVLNEFNGKFSDEQEKQIFVNNLLAFNKYCQEILPILFFI